MRIIVVSHLYPSPADSVPGSFVHSQVLALQKQGVEAAVIAPTPYVPFPLARLKDKWRAYSQVPCSANLEGVEVTYPRIIRTPGAALFAQAGNWYRPAVAREIKRQVRRQPVDLVHAQVGYPDGWAAAFVAQELGLPLVVTFHGQELQIICRRSPRLRALVQQVMDKAAAVVVASKKLHRLALEEGMDPQRLHLVPNGVDKFPPSSLPPALSDWLKDRRVLLSVAYLTEQKGVQHVIQAVSRLAGRQPNLCAVVVGEGQYRTKLEKLAQELNINDRVFFVGHVPRHQLGAYYQAADVFALPSRDEAFGVTYLEAMMAGLPVIGCRQEGIIPEATAAGAALSVAWANPTELSENIMRAFAGKEGLGKRGREMAVGYSWQASAEKLLAVYKSVIKDGGGR